MFPQWLTKQRIFLLINIWIIYTYGKYIYIYINLDSTYVCKYGIYTHLSYLYLSIHIDTFWIYYSVKCSGFLPTPLFIVLLVILFVCWSSLCILEHTSSILWISFLSLSTFSFTFSPFCVLLKKTLPIPRSGSYSSIFSLISFILSLLSHRSAVMWSYFFGVWCEVVKVYPPIPHPHMDIQLI